MQAGCYAAAFFLSEGFQEWQWHNCAPNAWRLAVMADPYLIS